MAQCGWCPRFPDITFKKGSKMRVIKVREKRLGGAPHTSVGESMEIIRTLFMNDTTWAVVLKETGEVIGLVPALFLF